MSLITPTLPTSGQDRGTEEIDVLNALTAIVNAINGNLDTANLAATVYAPYRTVHRHVGSMTSADGTTARIFDQAGAPFASGGSASRVPALIVPTSAWVLANRTPKLRLVTHACCNNVSPGGVGITVSLQPVTVGGTGGALTWTLGAAVSTVVVSPVQAGQASNVGADFSVPAVGAYVLTGAAGTAIPANVLVDLNMRVELHWV